jgi:hypothetical protein
MAGPFGPAFFVSAQRSNTGISVTISKGYDLFRMVIGINHPFKEHLPNDIGWCCLEVIGDFKIGLNVWHLPMKFRLTAHHPSDN